MMNETDVAKYKKKEESNTSKISSRATHKHIYVGCFCHRVYNFPYSGGTKVIDIIAPHNVCKICGKVGKHLDSSIREGNVFRLLSDEELKEKYPTFVTVEYDMGTEEKYIIEEDIAKLSE